jgi:hypothetical protein
MIYFYTILNTVRFFPNYRKRFISCMESLKYLDDKPVTDDERKIS